MDLQSKISKCLDPTSSLPTDVRFLFKVEGGNTKEIKAHKLILAIASDVFKRQFFGSLKEGEDIDIEDASQDVFLTMINYIYNKQNEWTKYDLRYLSSLYYLAEKYDMMELREKILASIPEQKVSDENVLDVAILAEKNIVHQPLSEALYDAAASFLKKKFNNKLDTAIDFFAETEATEVNSLVLMKMMARMKLQSNQKLPQSQNCKNCNQNSCLNDKVVTRDNFLTGAMVTDNFRIYNLDNQVRLDANGQHVSTFLLKNFKYKCF
eukprot:GFUD01091518.1.p1 GENE.GFUD01091518.1~~GFUD01091518.1.p1  ORF type:complete len:266 (-),score=68.70 GFUD01091518.1:168-965(-)